MVTSTWFMVLAPGITEEMFEQWYVWHIDVAKKQQDLAYYSVSRAFARQPPQAHGDVYRIAQLSWETADKLQDAFVSYSGAAIRGDAMLNMAPNPAMALTEQAQFEVMRPAIYDTFRGRYRTPTGTIIKVLAFGLSDHSDLGNWYRGENADLGWDDLVRQHLFGTSINRTFQIGLLDGAALPSPGQTVWDWMLELWFDTKTDAEAFLASPRFANAWNGLTAKSTKTHLSVHRTQDVLVSAAPIAHSED